MGFDLTVINLVLVLDLTQILVWAGVLTPLKVTLLLYLTTKKLTLKTMATFSYFPHVDGLLCNKKVDPENNGHF